MVDIKTSVRPAQRRFMETTLRGRMYVFKDGIGGGDGIRMNGLQDDTKYDRD